MKLRMDANGTDLRTGAILAEGKETVKTVPRRHEHHATPLNYQGGLAKGVNEMAENGVRGMRLRLERWESPMCPLLIVTDDEGVLRAIQFGDDRSRMDQDLQHHYGDDYSIEEGEAPVAL